MRRLLALVVIAAGACSGAPAPASFDAAHEPCRFCRMTGSTGRFAAQLVSPHEEPLFFDDIGCLLGYLKQTVPITSGMVAYVTDHQTGRWVRADRAVYTHHDAISTPMGSHLVAHESAASRDADPGARGGTPRAVGEVFAGAHLPGADK